MFTMDDLLEVAITMEKNGESVYNTSIKEVKNKDLKSMLKWMANEEASHGKWFTDLKNSFSLEMEEAELKEMVPQVLQDMMGENTLSLDDVDFSKIKTLSKLLETFIKFENDTILFYELLEMFIEDETVLEGLKKIILEEKSHVDQLESMLASLPPE
ncbi:ferritin family protein [Desulfobacula phenolica]|uniref:Rubrerythrin n=1 Tax=Desulfobacula phenolica TaxID=90732 RepID=A0A1H2DM27_9BACT|nr:ferritin family protein [Desulfobacula phenolica]SDT83889.1 Rubrerythrin [Desulfobacula phenolica]